jgi:thioesterase domain-containing protein
LRDLTLVNMSALQRYTPPVTPCRVSLFRPAGDARVDSLLVATWSQVATGGVQVHPIAGEGVDHFSVMKEPHVRALAVALTATIEEACAEEAVASGSAGSG